MSLSVDPVIVRLLLHLVWKPVNGHVEFVEEGGLLVVHLADVQFLFFARSLVIFMPRIKETPPIHVMENLSINFAFSAPGGILSGDVGRTSSTYYIVRYANPLLFLYTIYVVERVASGRLKA